MQPAPLSITVADTETGTSVAATPLPRPRENKARELYDAKRRPQAALLFRFIRDAGVVGVSWKECWALGLECESNGESNEWDVGPIVVWLRAHGVEVVARYDVVVGETRFYLVV
jgi:hypothetical protein